MERTSLAAIFELTQEERERLETAPFNAPPEHWQEFAAHVADQVPRCHNSGQAQSELSSC